ncbi:glycosyltransferase [Microbulbifer sp. ZKSA002]|uniref:glycosyltransferase n=1 Tax=Microbulbifer sp. ZKSA002 TaxID=3243388 RepID=UPI00403A1D75
MRNFIASFTALVTFHREGLFAHKTLKSIDRCRQFAEDHGIPCRILCSADKADALTVRTLRSSPFLRGEDSVVEVDLGDLGESRNYLVGAAETDFIGTFDGDDYFSENWIVEAVKLAAMNELYICHPEIIITFGKERQWWRQPDQLSDCVEKEVLLKFNPWNACMVTNLALAKEVPYQPVAIESGFGFEDWHWNAETMALGKIHRTPPKTIRYERRKATGSLCKSHEEGGATIKKSKIFD